MPQARASSPAMQNLIGNLTSMNFNHNGAFTFNPKAQAVRVVDFPEKRTTSDCKWRSMVIQPQYKTLDLASTLVRAYHIP